MDFDTLILGVAALLFVIALVALVVWAFKAFVQQVGCVRLPQGAGEAARRGGDGGRDAKRSSI